MAFEILLSFMAASLLLALMPGPDNIFVLTESLTSGQKNGIAISVGLSCGVMIHTLAAATGLSLIIQQSAIAFSIIKWLGAVYMFFLAYKTITEQQSAVEFNARVEGTNKSLFQLIQKGFLMNMLNPKVSLFFIAFLPQFVSPTGFNISLQMIILGIVFMLQSLLVFCLISILSGKLSKYLNSPKFWKISKWAKVSVLLVLGVALMLSHK